MKSSRRDFIKKSGLFGAAMLALPKDFYGKTDSFPEFIERIGVCTDLSNNAILANAGYIFIEEAVRNFLVPDADEPGFQNRLALLKQSKLPVEVCNVFIPGNLKSVGPGAVHNEILKFAEIVFRRAALAGVKIIVFGSGGSRSIPKDWSVDESTAQFVSLGKQMAIIAERYNVVIALEPLNSKECNFINTAAEGAAIVRKIEHKNFRLMVDIYHMMMENETPEEIYKYGDLVYHVHIAEKSGRSAPGVNNEDFRPFFKALKDTGYKGRISIECNWTDLEKQSGLAIQTIKRQLSEV